MGGLVGKRQSPDEEALNTLAVVLLLDLVGTTIGIAAGLDLALGKAEREETIRLLLDKVALSGL